MPGNPNSPTFPGVYIKEIPSGVRTITGVATSITAFIGRALRGPDNQPVTINSFSDYVRQFGGLSLDSSLSYAVNDFFLNGGSEAIIERLVQTQDTPAANGNPAIPKAAAAEIDLATPAGGGAGNVLPLVAASKGKWGDNLSVAVDHLTKGAIGGNPDPDTSLFNLIIFEKDPVTGGIANVEKFLNVSIDDKNPRYVPRVLRQRSQLVRVKRNPADTDWIVPPQTPSDVSADDASQFKPATMLKNGSDGGPLNAAMFTPTTPKQGINALDNADLVNILCIPPYLDTGDVDTSVVAAAAAYCENRRAILLVDPPSAWTTAAAPSDSATGVSSVGTNSKNAALFFPRLQKTNLLRENQLDTFVPSGTVAGIFARTDAQRGVWKAPAGLDANLVGVSALSVPLTDDENGNLNPLGVNCLRTFPAAGSVVWGSRTLQGNDRLASEWKYIPVRRTALFLEESLFRGTQWVVFEPNDEPLWSQIRLNVGAFMHNLFVKGAFQGKTPREAYFVKCDSETTTQNDIDLGIVNIVVGFAPLKPAEFVIISIQQIAGQIQV